MDDEWKSQSLQIREIMVEESNMGGGRNRSCYAQADWSVTD